MSCVDSSLTYRPAVQQTGDVSCGTRWPCGSSGWGCRCFRGCSTIELQRRCHQPLSPPLTRVCACVRVEMWGVTYIDCTVLWNTLKNQKRRAIFEEVWDFYHDRNIDWLRWWYMVRCSRSTYMYRVYFGGARGGFGPPPWDWFPPPLEIGFPHIWYGIAPPPLDFYLHPPALKFASMYLPPLEKHVDTQPW